MKFEEMLLKRESCRAYQDKPVSRDDLMKICDAGRLSPSGCNAQPWKFLIADEAEAKAAVCDGVVVDGGKTGAMWRESVPAFIVLIEEEAPVKPMVLDYYKNSQIFAHGDIGMAAMNMMYQAMDLGLSTCVIGMNDQKKMEAGLGIPEGHLVRMVLAVGYSAETNTGRAKIRRPIEEVVCLNGYKA